MSNPPIQADSVCQIGFIVSDIEAAAQKFCAIFGTAMPPILLTSPNDEVTYKGAPSQATSKLAFFNAGQVQIELIEPDEKPSVWRDFLNEHGEGIHHIAFGVKDTDETLRYLGGFGIEMVQQGLYSDRSGVYTYLDATPQLGVIIELLQSFNRG